MKRHLGLVLICACSAFAVGCEPLPEEDDVSMVPPADIEAPLHTAKSADYNKYSEQMRIKSPFDPKDIHVETSSTQPAVNNQMHVAGTQRPPNHAN